MSEYIFIISFVFGTLSLTALSSASLATAHEAHKMACNQTAVNAMSADIQAMPDGDAKATAMKEMEAAQEMMASKNMKGCESHMHKAMEAIEE